MPFRLRIGGIQFSDGKEIDLADSGVVLLVGPNNAGKSAALRNIMALVQLEPLQRPALQVVPTLQISREGSEEDFERWLQTNAFRIERQEGGGRRVFYQRPNASAPWASLQADWSGGTDSFPIAGPFFLFYGSADQRLGLVGEAAAYDPLTDAPNNPLQVLFADPDLQQSLSETCYEAFGIRLTLARIWGSPLRLHLGETDEPVEVPASRAYMDAVSSMPLLHEQGDGMRSFMGVMLALVTAQFPIVLIDEPEAFLHPPQARLLGRKLASERPESTQVFVATHDSAILQGALAPPDANVTVVRLVRDGNVNRASVLLPDQLREIWRDPLLRHSNVLDGLFHRGVVVSESDADSRYYAAVLDAKREREAAPPHDLLFTQSGGKDRLPLVVKALRALDIPVAAVADIDVLRERTLLKRIVEVLGGSWAEVDASWRVVADAIGHLGAAPPLAAVRADIKAALDNESGPNLSRTASESIRAATRIDDSWSRVKSGGVGVLPQGDPSARATTLLDRLAALGLFVVPVGELERWESDLPGHGPSWAAAAIERGRHDIPGSQAEQFVDRLTAFFS
jgi:hypothetical protein